MALFDSRNSKFFIEDAGGTERDLSAYLTEISGLPGSRVLDEVTSLADSGRRFIPGRQEGIITIRGVFDNTVSSGPDAVLGPLLSHSAPVGFSYFPHGDAPTSTTYSGKCWVESYDISSSLDNRVMISATLRVDGVVGR